MKAGYIGDPLSRQVEELKISMKAEFNDSKQSWQSMLQSLTDIRASLDATENRGKYGNTIIENKGIIHTGQAGTLAGAADIWPPARCCIMGAGPSIAQQERMYPRPTPSLDAVNSNGG